jgi:pimeloyl-ACP methyl ester carboxylesterase
LIAFARGAFIAGASAALAACGVKSRLRSALYNCRLPEALPDVATGTLLRGGFQSRVLRKRIGYIVTRSPGNQRLRGIAYAFPGRGRTADELLAALGYDKYLTSLAAELDFPALAVATVDGGEPSSHHRSEFDERQAMFDREFVPAVRHELGLAADVPESLLGYSIGGLGALLAAAHEPNRYRAVAVAAPTIWQSYEQQRTGFPDTFENRTDFERHSIFARIDALRLQELLIDCGRADPFADTIELLGTLLPHAVVRLHEGCHDDAFFRSAVPDQLRFVGHRLSLR